VQVGVRENGQKVGRKQKCGTLTGSLTNAIAKNIYEGDR